MRGVAKSDLPFYLVRYKTREQPFEWYLVKIEHIEDLLHQYLDFSNVLYALEIGCGNSNFADDLRGFVPCVHAFDYAMNVLEHKRRLGSQVELSCMDACHLPFRYNVFDLVVSPCVSASCNAFFVVAHGLHSLVMKNSWTKRP